MLHAEGLDAYVVRRLGLPFRDVDWTVWGDLLDRVHNPQARGDGRPGRQVRRPARRLSVGDRGAAGRRHSRTGREVKIDWVPSDSCETPAGAADGAGRRRRRRDPGRLRHPRHRGQDRRASGTPASTAIPTLGLCLGLQCMVIETARHLAGIEQANSAEFDPETPDPVIATMADQLDIVAGNADLGGTMRLGAYPATLTPGSVVAAGVRDAPTVSERHRHRYEVNNVYRERLEAAGLVISGTSPDGRLVEFVELPASVHPFFVGTQAHPELKSRPTRAHPLFRAFIGAALEYNAAERLPVADSRGRARIGRAASTCQRQRAAGSAAAAVGRSRDWTDEYPVLSSQPDVHRAGDRAADRRGADERRRGRHPRDRRPPGSGRRRRARRRRTSVVLVSQYRHPVASTARRAAGRPARRRG